MHEQPANVSLQCVYECDSVSKLLEANQQWFILDT